MDPDAALVLVSAVTPVEDASSFLATIEHMQKISADEKDALVKSLDAEWKSILVDQPTSGVSPAKPEYWDQPASKLRRIVSEAVTPTKP